ncbi:CRP-like cAMP-binding protein [Sphingomonas naasensis]|nr:CRP-like cAMP-binding protein [Sphingomonas naasensis]
MQGAVRRCRYSADGTRQVIGFAIAGDVIGLEEGDWDETAEAVTEVLLSPLEKAEGHGRASGNAALLRQGLGEALQTLAMLGRRTAVERLAAFLLHFADRTGQGATIDLPMSREDIADHLGINMHTASRAFSQLIRCGFIELDGPHCVCVRQPGQLGLLAGQSDCDELPPARPGRTLVHAGIRP